MELGGIPVFSPVLSKRGLQRILAVSAAHNSFLSRRCLQREEF